MKTGVFLASLALWALMCWGLEAWAAAPARINYQGALREGGIPVTGARKARFLIYDASSGGIAHYDTGEVQVNVSTGIFRHALTPPAAIAWQSFQPYLEVRVGTGAATTVLLPRDPIGATFFALHASTADAVAPGSVTDVQVSPLAAIAPEKIAGVAVVQ